MARLGRSQPFKPQRLNAGIVGAAPVTGTLDATLDALTLSGAATVSIAASASNTLGALALTGLSTVDIGATLSGTMGALTLSGAAVVDVTATASNTLGVLSLTGNAGVAITATMSSTLDAVTLSGTVTVANGPSASLTSSFDAITLSGVAEITGVGNVPEPVVSSGSSGGGPSASRWYQGKYRGELRRTIERASRDLRPEGGKRKPRKRVIDVAREISAAVSISGPPVQVFTPAPELANLEIIRVQILDIARNLLDAEALAGAKSRKRNEDRTAQLLQSALVTYMEEVRRIEEREEKEILAIIKADARH